MLSSGAISFMEAKQLTIDYLYDWMGRLPTAQQTSPVLTFSMRSWSIPAMVAQVQMQTDVGTRYVYSHIQSLGYTIQ